MEGIKMVSGQTPGPAPGGPYAPYQPVYQQPSRPAIDYMRPFASDTMLALASVLGLFLLWLGSFVWGLVDASDREWGLAIKSIGMLILTVALYLGGLLRVDMEKWVRVTLILAATLLIIFVGYWTTDVWF